MPRVRITGAASARGRPASRRRPSQRRAARAPRRTSVALPGVAIRIAHDSTTDRPAASRAASADRSAPSTAQRLGARYAQRPAARRATTAARPRPCRRAVRHSTTSGRCSAGSGPQHLEAAGRHAVEQPRSTARTSPVRGRRERVPFERPPAQPVQGQPAVRRSASCTAVGIAVDAARGSPARRSRSHRPRRPAPRRTPRPCRSCAATRSISSASVTTVPVKPSRSRSSPVVIAGLTVARSLGVQRRHEQVAGHHRPGARAIAGPERHQLGRVELGPAAVQHRPPRDASRRGSRRARGSA